MKLSCSGCGVKLDLTGQPVGARFSCPVCGMVLKVPAKDAAQRKDIAVKENELDSLAEGTTEAVKKLKINCYNCGVKIDLTGEEPFKQVNCPACHAQFQIPKRFSHFLLEERLGQNANFSVYRALDLDSNREVCLKMMSPELSAQRELVDSFLSVAEKLTLLKGPNIVSVYSYGEHEGQCFLVMEFVPSLPLEAYLKKHGVLSLSSVYACIKGIVQGLDAAYGQGLGHNNISLANIFIDHNGHIKVTDFAYNYALYKVDLNKNIPRYFNPRYVSYELLKGRENGLAGDIYSLGAIFYHLLTGVAPFPGNTPAEVMSQRENTKPAPPNEVRREVPCEVSDFIMAMMSHKHYDRPSSFAEISKKITYFLDPDLLASTPVYGSEPPSLDHTKVTQHRPKEKSKLIFTLISAIVVLLLALVIPLKLPEDKANTKSISQSSVDDTKEMDTKPISQSSVDDTKEIDTTQNQQVQASPNPGIEPGEVSENIPDINIEPGEVSENIPGIDNEKVTQPDGLSNVPDSSSSIMERGHPVKISARPLPPGISFRPYAKELIAYLDLHSGGSYDQETVRVKILKSIKPYLQNRLTDTPYRGQIHVKSRQLIDGEVVAASAEALTIRSLENDITFSLPWSHFDTQQFKVFLEYYISSHKELLHSASSDLSTELKRRLAADYLKIAVLCDWYNEEADLPAYMKKCIELDPGLKSRVETLLPSIGE